VLSVFERRVGAALEKERDDRSVTGGGGAMKRCQPRPRCARIHVRPALEEGHRHVERALFSRRDEAASTCSGARSTAPVPARSDRHPRREEPHRIGGASLCDLPEERARPRKRGSGQHRARASEITARDPRRDVERRAEPIGGGRRRDSERALPERIRRIERGAASREDLDGGRYPAARSCVKRAIFFQHVAEATLAFVGPPREKGLETHGVLTCNPSERLGFCTTLDEHIEHHRRIYAVCLGRERESELARPGSQRLLATLQTRGGNSRRRRPRFRAKFSGP
jgi:hypothetical protein